MAGELLYLDSSAIVKLVVAEPETRALRHLLRAWPERVSSVIASIEVERAARRVRAGTVRKARTVLSGIGLVELDDAVMRVSASLGPAEVRTLDAIHLASAMSLGEDLGALCTYDARLARAASAARIDVVAPA